MAQSRSPSASGVRAPAPLAVFAVATLAAVASDLTTPLAATTLYVGAILFAVTMVFGVLYFRSGDKGYEAGMAALVLPVALCGYAVFSLREGGPGQPQAGVAARALPALERLQANSLPLSPDTRTALLVEAALRAGDTAAKTAALEKIPEQASAALQKYLYQTAAKSGDDRQKQRVAAMVLERAASQPLYVKLTNDAKSTLFEQYLDGSSFRFTPADHDAAGPRARLATNKEEVLMDGGMEDGTLTMTGRANLADHDLPLTLKAAMGADMIFTGTFDFGHGEAIPFTLEPFRPARGQAPRLRG